MRLRLICCENYTANDAGAITVPCTAKPIVWLDARVLPYGADHASGSGDTKVGNGVAPGGHNMSAAW